MTLYEIDNNIRLFLDQMINSVDENGELIDIDPTQLEQLNAQRRDKLESIACYYKETMAEAEMIKAEEDRLKSRREAAEKRAERLKELLSRSLLDAGDSKFSTPKCAVSFRTSEQVVIPDENLLDKAFMKQSIKYTPDKKAIKKAIKDGAEVRGAYIENKQNIQIN